MEAQFTGDLSEHLIDIARHWSELAPYGEAATARQWTIRAAEDAVQRLAYEEGARLYRAALTFDATSLPVERCRVQVALGRAAYFAGDLHGCVDAAIAAADAARTAHSPELMGEAALVLEAAPAAGRRRAPDRPVGPSGCYSGPRCSRWRSARTAPAPRCGGSSGGLTR
jgi:hypothetical protein